MAPAVSRCVRLAKRPRGLPGPECFEVGEETLREPRPGQLGIRVETLSIDAAMRAWLDEDCYIPPVPVGGVMRAFGIGEVVESRATGIEPGTRVVGPLGVREHAVLAADAVRALDPAVAAPNAWLGVLGLTTGVTAYFGMLEVGAVQAGETVVVSGAAGACGSVAGQLARLQGARVIGIAGGAAKVRYVTDELRYDACIDYKGEDVVSRLRELAPHGVDVYFDNVGGPLLDVVLDQIRTRARVVICGAISQYNDRADPRGPALYLRLAERYARMEGFTVMHFADRFAEAEERLASWLDAGELRLHEQIEHGLERFPEVLNLLFSGGHHGKLLLAVDG